MKLSPRYDGPPVLVVDGPVDDQAVVVARQRRRLESLLAELDDEEWRSPSRCDGWSVQDVVAHLVGVNAFWESSIAAGLAGTPSRVLAAFDPAAHPPRMIEPMRTLGPQEVLEQLVQSDDGFLGALAPLDDAGWSTAAESPAGHVEIRFLAQHALWDGWIHERDVAIPLDREPAREPDEIASCLKYAVAIGPALASSRPGAVTGHLGVRATDPDLELTVDVGDTIGVRNASPSPDTPCLCGDAVELVEALSVRGPLPADAPAEWHAHLRSLATVFDTEPAAGR